MLIRTGVLSAIAFASCAFLTAQLKGPDHSAPVAAVEQHGHHAAEPVARYHRFICLVHMTGSGRPGDPFRPEYAPAATEQTAAGILSWSVQLTDNKNMAIVHFVAVDRDAFNAILQDKRAEVKVFEIGRDKPEDIEKEMRKHKKDFVLADFQVVAQ